MADWLKFFLIRLPVAIVATAIVVEGLAALLSGVTLHRSNVDDLASAVRYDKHAYPVVLLGDSVTHNVVHQYRIGSLYEVADLTTHAHAGMVSELFLLTRYLESGHRPHDVVIASSRGVYVDALNRSMFDYYISSVFTRPKERLFLQQYYPDYIDSRWRPAALSMTTKLGEPLFSLIRHPGDDIPIAPEVPSAAPALEHYSESDLGYTQSVLENRISAPATIRPEIKAVLREISSLGRQYNFKVHIIWPPVETKMLAAWEATGKIQSINDQLVDIFKEQGTDVAIDDVNAGQSYPYFDRDLIHIRGIGWEQRYADQLAGLINQFSQEKSGQTVNLN